MTPKKYLILFLCSFFVLSALVVGTNIVIDPYSVIGTPRFNGLNQYKVDINSRVRLSKSYQPLRSDFNTLIVGNSRVEMGIDPENKCLSLNGKKTYNLGIPGAGVGYQAASALNLVYQKPIKTILISVDFTDFLVMSKKSVPETYSGIPKLSNISLEADGSQNRDYQWSYVKDHYQAIYSLDAFLSSLKTVLLQSPYGPSRNESGFNPAMDFVEMTSAEGVGRLFKQKENELESKYMKGWGLYYSGGELSYDFSYLEEFITRTTEKGVKVVVFTNPLHENFWGIMDRSGLMEQNEIFLNEVKAILSRSGNDLVDFWDFSGDSPFIHENVIEARKNGVGLKWFWEPAHYKKELGDIMVETMFSEACGTKQVFGEQVISSST